VLTLFEKLTPDELPFYLNLMAHLARHGIPCPAPVADKNNQFLGSLNGKPACIVSRLNGKSVTEPTVANCAAVGAMLGQMHNAGQSFTENMPNARGAEWRSEAAEQVMPFLSTRDKLLLEVEVAYHSEHRLTDLPHGIVHADLFRDNVLMDGERVGGLIDFYFACNDCLLYDVAITVNDWCMHADGTLDTARTQAFLQAYNTARPFTPEEQKSWPTALRLGALRFWTSRLFDLHLPRAGEMVNPHNPDQFKHILRNHIVGANATWL
jgi:homoserine kinase type II